MIVWTAVLVGRSLWLGEPMTIPLHRLENGALLLFTFFMISDPKTTPDSRLGRILFAVLVALGARYVQFKMFHTNGILWSLAACSVLVPLIDLLLPGGRYTWKQTGGSSWSDSLPSRWHFAPGLLQRVRSVAFTSQRATPESSIARRRWRSSATATAP
jgi:hypothetical protein